jgi:hypothetical protein
MNVCTKCAIRMGVVFRNMYITHRDDCDFCGAKRAVCYMLFEGDSSPIDGMVKTCDGKDVCIKW